MIVVLTGGTGGAKFVDGLRQMVPQEQLTIVVNTGDDLRWWGLSISPDIDSIVYVLSGLLSKERGWGVQTDTFFCLQAMAQYGEPAWFKIGDRDLATHLLRSQLITDGKTLAEATDEIARRMGIAARILPMSNDRVETRIQTPSGELCFEEYFVKRRYQDVVLSVRFAGADQAEPAPGVVEAVLSADAVILAPSNPVTSIGPILAIPQIRQALRETAAEVIAGIDLTGKRVCRRRKFRRGRRGRRDTLPCDRQLVFCDAAHCRVLNQDHGEVFSNPSDSSDRTDRSERYQRAAVRNHLSKLSYVPHWTDWPVKVILNTINKAI